MERETERIDKKYGKDDVDGFDGEPGADGKI